MHPATSLHDLKSLILSHNPVVAIETGEEERVEQLVQAVSLELGLEVFEWTVSQGLGRWPERTPNYTLREAAAMLAHLRGLTVEGVFLLKDLTRHLEDPAAARCFADAARQFARSRSTMVVTGASLRFPPEIEHLVVHFDLALPGPKELREVVESVLRLLRRAQARRDAPRRGGARGAAPRPRGADPQPGAPGGGAGGARGRRAPGQRHPRDPRRQGGGAGRRRAARLPAGGGQRLRARRLRAPQGLARARARSASARRRAS